MPVTTDDLWEKRIFRVKADHPNWGAGRVHKRIEAYAKRKRIPGMPGERTVGRILQKWEELSDGEKTQYRTFNWPESMEDGDLEWGASQAALELLAYSHALGAGRPSNRLVEWFWRVSQAIPNAPIRHRIAVTLEIAMHKLLGKEIPPGVEWWMAFTAVSDGLPNGAYETAVLDPNNPIPEYTPASQFPPRNTQGELDPAVRQDREFAYAMLWGSLGINRAIHLDDEPKELDYYLELFNQGGDNP